ncbi:juvenile hormone acid O-methyltransferase-like [Pseudomyrmex gracilis]|uniref:juvenile hormone acid O-methyltransferase-like n=1 Tax=Pseudomyrmex gracilis TaxID=219809 RepID=UPI000995A9AB|nr:juvenile hormone acid O-methyltransferase-like [Pseudomyrmex gracilis]
MNPPVYDLMHSRDDRVEQNILRILEEYEDNLKVASGKCMDVGCGTGYTTRNLILPALHPNAAMIGTDISESMVDFANKQYGDGKRLKFEVLDVQTNDLPEKYVSEFDYIFSFHALQWCTNIEQAFTNIYRMLRPGGIMLTILVASHTVIDIFKTLAKDNRFAPYLKKHLIHTFPYNNVEHPQKKAKLLLKDIGFEIRHCSVRQRYGFSTDEFINAIISLFSPITEMTADEKEEFENSFKREYKSRQVFYPSKNENKAQTRGLDLYSLLIINAEKKKEIE